MSIYKTYDYSTVSVPEIRDINNLSKIKDLTVRELCEDRKNNLLIFPRQLDQYKDGVADSVIFTIDGEKLHTGDLLGFIGVDDTTLTIGSRFAKDDPKDYFLHYMLQKVFCVNLLDLKHFSSESKIFDFLAYMFPYYLKRALKLGLYKQYCTRNYNDANVKGRVDVPSHIKHNIPFAGRIAYKVKEYTYDNYLTQLIRHTIEFLRVSHMSQVLKIDSDTEAYVARICNATSYSKGTLKDVIEKNRKPFSHPFYSAYGELQKLCLHILQYKRLMYGGKGRPIYGLLFSGSWLWEEFLYKTVMRECGFRHPHNREGKGGIYLFEKNDCDLGVLLSRCRRYPDYFKENSCILDAKYKHLENNRIDRNDMHQIISYMHVENIGVGGFVFPHSQNNIRITVLGTLRGCGGKIYNIGVPIPRNMQSYSEFEIRMSKILDELKDKVSELANH